MTGQPPDARLDGEDSATQRVVAALDGYRRAVRAVASAAPAASVRARAERRAARNRAASAVVAAAAVVAVVAGGVALADRAPRPELSDAGQRPATSPPTVAPCRSATLFPRLGRPTISGTEATGSIELFNTGSPCTVSGYIGLQLRATGGTSITTSVQREPGTAATITIATGRSAVATIVWTWSDGSGIRCETVDEVAVTAPGETAVVTGPWVSGDANSVCRGVVKLYPLTQ